MLQRRRARPVRVDAWRDLGQLVRVTEQDDRACRAAHGHDVGQRHLAGLVHDEHVEQALHLRAGEQPGGAGGDLEPPRAHRRRDVLWIVGQLH
jgi:hypothetical protein